MGSYNVDFYAWAYEQAHKLRAGELVDAENIAEELETLRRSEEQQLTRAVDYGLCPAYAHLSTLLCYHVYTLGGKLCKHKKSGFENFEKG